MIIKQTTIIKIVFFVIYIFLFNNIFAQTEQDSIIKKQEHSWIKKIPFTTVPFDYQSVYFNKSTNFIQPSFMGMYQPNNQIRESIIFNKLLFNQRKAQNIFPNLGVYEHFDNSFNYEANGKIIFDFGIGLVKQNTILTSNNPNYQFSFHTSMEYEITNWLSAYIFGQYITPPVNKSIDFFDPLICRNPLFFQTEMGGGLKAKYKNVKADIGVKAMYNTQFKQSSPVGTMNSKVTIGF
jgi:hypothetical protein